MIAIPPCMVEHILAAPNRRAALLRVAQRVDSMLREDGAGEDEIRRFVSELCDRVTEAQQ